MVAVGNDRLFAAFAKATGRDRLTDDAHFRANADRVDNRDALAKIISARLLENTSRHWAEILGQASIPVSEINTVDKAVADQELRSRQMILDAEHRTAGRVRMLGRPVKLSRTPASLRLSPPTLGEHTAEVLRQWPPRTVSRRSAARWQSGLG
jgi:crotonobetainyl-CoA:carnitine CoA-transferase CaiB-like acyl-CoA transferase